MCTTAAYASNVWMKFEVRINNIGCPNFMWKTLGKQVEIYHLQISFSRAMSALYFNDIEMASIETSIVDLIHLTVQNTHINVLLDFVDYPTSHIFNLFTFMLRNLPLNWSFFFHSKLFFKGNAKVIAFIQYSSVKSGN